MSINSVDDLIVKNEQQRMGNSQADVQPIQEIPIVEPANSQDKVPENDGQEAVSAENLQSEPENPQNEETDNETDNKPATSEAKSIDEYGNPLEPPKTYTEEEVQRIVRDRLSRGHLAQQATPQQARQVEEAAKNFQPDPNSEENWQAQLKNFVKDTLNEVQQETQTKHWQEEEKKRQAIFEDKFTTGMAKYKDFHQTVAGKPITDSMMLATRSLENPAAFIYGAAKMYPQDLERIAKINDPYQQAAEVGRLHEKMVKVNKMATSAGKPLPVPKGDVPQAKGASRPSIDSLIAQHEKQKFIGKRR